jgi:hypothetical protein
MATDFSVPFQQVVKQVFRLLAVMPAKAGIQRGAGGIENAKTGFPPSRE